MPKLAEYVQQASIPAIDAAQLARQEPAASTSGSAASSAAGGAGHQGTEGLGPQHAAAAAKLQADYQKRVREHGPRMFRWADGSLRPAKPPPSPYSAANRERWEPLVRHCRTHGGDRGFERTGQSVRYGLGVSHQQHAAYLAVVGLEPETSSAGARVGLVAGLADPLAEPEAALNSYYSQQAAVVFADARGRLL